MKKMHIAALAGAACVAATAVFAQNLAIVNGKSIPLAKYNSIVAAVKDQSAQTGRPLPVGYEDRIKSKLIETTALVQAAEARGLNTTPEFREKMDEARDAILISLLYEQYKKTHPVTDAQAKAEYDRLVAANGTEYRASHILVKTEAEAQKVEAELKKGANFGALARKYSLDPGSARRGGDLNWSVASNYVPPFAQALETLKKGQITATPVKSPFGYHIIRLDDVRKAPVPAFEQVKGQIRDQMEQQQIMRFQQEMQAHVKIR